MLNSFVTPVKILTGEGAVKHIPAEIKAFDAKRIFIIADPTIVEVGLVNNIEKELIKCGIKYMIYSDLIPEPTIAIAQQAIEALKEFHADFIIGIGGGSALDIAKVASVISRNNGAIKDYLNLSGTRKLEEKGLPKILIPTTSGTGSEVTDIAVFSLDDTKDVISHEFLLADVAIVDPELTYTLSPKVTASSGIDALTHAVEALVSIYSSPLTDTLALESIRKISSNIRNAVWQGSFESRREMAWGSLMAGLSFYNAGVSGVHALAYPLGGLYKIPHGESNAVMLTYVFDYIWPSCIDKMNLIAHSLGIQTKYKNKREIAIEAVRELKNIVSDVGIPLTLDKFGVKEQDIELLAQKAIKQKRLLRRSPKPYNLEAVKEIYKSAFNGITNV